MVSTCAHVYPSGKTCGRIPPRGESLCRDHRRTASVTPEIDPTAFEAEMYRECDRLAALPLDQILTAAQVHLTALDSFIERQATPRLRIYYNKATIAITEAIDRILAQPRVLSRAIPGLTPSQIDAIVSILWNARPDPCPAPSEEARLSSLARPA
jgi:hypothetical protein